MPNVALTQTMIELVHDFLDERLTGKEFVIRYDDLMVSSFDWKEDDPKSKAMDEFHDILALYVENPEWRKAHEDYYGPAELKKTLEDFLKFLEG